MTPESVTPDVFELLERGVKELTTESIAEPLGSDASILDFLTQFFAQFFAAELGEELAALDAAAAVRAGVLLRQHDEVSSEVKDLVRRFRLFCKVLPDVQGSDYGGTKSANDDVFRNFHEEFMPDTLSEIEEWANSGHDAQLKHRAYQAARDWDDALTELDNDD